MNGNLECVCEASIEWSPAQLISVGLLVAFLDLVVGSSLAHFFLSLGAYHRYLSFLDSMLFLPVIFKSYQVELYVFIYLSS
jgi:hypothetical protein